MNVPGSHSCTKAINSGYYSSDKCEFDHKYSLALDCGNPHTLLNLQAYYIILVLFIAHVVGGTIK